VWGSAATIDRRLSSSEDQLRQHRGSGNDTLNGGADADGRIGGVDNDRFVFSVFTDTGTTATLLDIINDFVVGGDNIKARK
jgi:hypothetical protein